MSLEIVGTGNEIIDALKDLQAQTEDIGEIGHRLSYVRRGMIALRASNLVNNTFLLETDLAICNWPDTPPNSRSLLPEGLRFSGRLSVFRYLVNHRPPIHAIMAHFNKIVVSDAYEQSYFRRAQLEVPVFSITSFCDL